MTFPVSARFCNRKLSTSFQLLHAQMLRLMVISKWLSHAVLGKRTKVAHNRPLHVQYMVVHGSHFSHKI